ncbi:MAG: hypothetical protein ACR2II_11200 [Chthoniobacterales bacterium]
MKKPTKAIKDSLISAPALLTLLAAAISFGLASSVRAAGDGQVCGPQTLRGSYVFTAHGFNIVSGVAQPKAIVEGIDFNGDGTLSVPFGTLSVNGFIIQIAPGGVGTYTLDASCQGTLTFTSGPVNYNIFVLGGGKEISMIQTDANTVFEGTVKRVSR